MKKKLLILCAILWLIAFVQMIGDAANSKTTSDALITAFNNNMYMDINTKLKGVAFLGNRYYMEEEKKNIVENMSKSLGITKPYSIEVSDKKVLLTKTGSGVITEISLITEEKQLPKKVLSQKHYLTVSMNSADSLSNCYGYMELLKNAYKEQKLESDINITIKGDVFGELTVNKKNEIATKLTDNLDAKIVSESSKNDIFSLYAYSDKIDNYIVYGDNRININIIIRYNDTTGMSEVYVSSPIMLEDY